MNQSKKFSTEKWEAIFYGTGEGFMFDGQSVELKVGLDSLTISALGFNDTLTQEQIANAHLIKSAPKLYAMLETVISEMHGLIDEVNDQRASLVNMLTENEPDYYDMETLHNIQVLLAEARGER